MSEDLIRNILYILESSGKNKTQFSATIDVERTRFSRFLSGKGKKPAADITSKIASYYNIDIGCLSGPHHALVEFMGSQIQQPHVLSFTSVRLHKSKWIDFANRLKGQYNIYYGKTEDNCAIVSILEIGDPTPSGIEVRFYNPFRDSSGISYYEYKGVAFPVNELLYIYAEQTNGSDYEILSIILTVGRTPVTGSMDGIIMGIGVKDGASAIAANSLICRRATQKQSKELTTRDLSNLGAGYIKYEKIDKFIRDRLDEQKIRVGQPRK